MLALRAVEQRAVEAGRLASVGGRGVSGTEQRGVQVAGEGRGEALALATQAVGAVSRTDLEFQVREESDGRLELDPPVEDG